MTDSKSGKRNSPSKKYDEIQFKPSVYLENLRRVMNGLGGAKLNTERNAINAAYDKFQAEAQQLVDKEKSIFTEIDRLAHEKRQETEKLQKDQARIEYLELCIQAENAKRPSLKNRYNTANTAYTRTCKPIGDEIERNFDITIPCNPRSDAAIAKLVGKIKDSH